MKPFWLSGGLLSSALCLCAAGCVMPGELIPTSLITTTTPPPSATPQTVPAPDYAPKPTLLNAGKTPADELKACLRVGKAYDESGNDDAAVEQFEKVMKLDPNEMTVSRRLCVLYDRQRNFPKADELYRKLEKAHANDAELLADWGYSYYLRLGKENYVQAEKLLRRALAIDPKLARAHNDLGLVLGVQGRYPEAFNEFRASGLTEAEAHCDMAFVYWWKKKDKDDKLSEAKARAEAKLAIEKDPSCVQARELLIQLDNPHPASEKVATPTDQTATLRREGTKPRAASLTPEMEAEMHAKAQRAAERMKQGLPAEPTGEDKSGQLSNFATVTTQIGPPVAPIATTPGRVWLPMQPQAAPPVPGPKTADTTTIAPLPPLPTTPTWTAPSDKGAPATISFEK